MALSDKQKRFVEEYLVDLNATQAAIRAGYSRKTASEIGYQNMSRPEIADAVAAAMQARSERTGITADRVVQELALIGFARMRTYMRTTSAGDPYLDLSAVTDEQSAALAEVTVDDFVDGRGKDARAVKRVRVKLHSKTDALDKLGRHLGIYAPEKHEHTGKDGKPIEVAYSDAERARRVAALVAKIQAEGETKP